MSQSDMGDGSESKVALQIIEDCNFHVPEIAGKIESLRIQGVRGWITSEAHYRANKVSLTAGSTAEADWAIQQVLHRFAVEGKGVHWMVGPLNTVPDLASRLQAAGFFKLRPFVGMMLSDLSRPVPVNQAVEVREVDGPEMAQHVDLVTRVFSISREHAELDVLRNSAALDNARIRAYLAYLDGGDVGCGFLHYSPDQAAVVLRLAGVLEPYRHQGVYRTLVARRLANARADGVKLALTEAQSHTSAPILTRLGFQEIYRLDAYAWQPD